MNRNTGDRGKKKTRNWQQYCRCQRCAACVDNARWELIFRAKFADPLYYNRNQVRNSSPLTDL